MDHADAFVLEVYRAQDGLKMGLFGSHEMASTLKHYSQRKVDFSEIESLVNQSLAVINKSALPGQLSAEGLNSLRKAGSALWGQLITFPVREKLKGAQAADLVLSLDEELIGIPWELLYDGSNFLCLNYNLGRLVRTKQEASQVRYRNFSATRKMLILANPTNDLQAAYQEGVNIRNQFDRKRTEVRIDFKSTHIDRLYLKKNLSDYDIVHFAGHCEYDPHIPEQNGWILSDGVFSAQDLMGMGSSASLPSLIFSNACHSAHEGSFSLAQAFLFSGVRHYIGSLRRVEDPVSVTFAKEFYSQLIAGKSVGESLRLSRIRLVKEYGLAHISWAGYLLYGDPNFALFQHKARQPLPKPKKDPQALKKKLILFSAGAAALALAASLHICLPSINPNTYCQFSRAQALFQKGDNQQVLNIAKRISEREPLYLAAYPLLADTFRRIGDKENALKSHYDYIRFSEKKKDLASLTTAYSSLGWFYHLQGQYPKAFEFYQRALALAQKRHDKANEADCLSKLAVWYMDKNDYETPLELLFKSSSINRERQNSPRHRYLLACDYFNLGLLFINRDDYDTAKEFYDKSFKIFSRLKLKHELSDYYFNVGEIYTFKKEYQKSLDYYEKGLNLDLAQGNIANLAGDYAMMGELYVQMESPKQAEKLFLQGLEIAERISANAEIGWNAHQLGLLYKDMGRKNKAREYLRRAQEVYLGVDPKKFQEIKAVFLALDSN